MSISTQIKNAGGVLMGLAFMLGMLALGAALLTGAAVFSLWVLKWTFPCFLITVLVSVFLLGPASLFPPSRGFAAMGLIVASHVFGAILWVWAMAYAYTVWGFFGVIVGLMLFGVGVVPVALLAALLHGDWATLGLIVFAGILAIGLRILGNWLAEKVDQMTYRASLTPDVRAAYRVED